MGFPSGSLGTRKHSITRQTQAKPCGYSTDRMPVLPVMGLGVGVWGGKGPLSLSPLPQNKRLLLLSSPGPEFREDHQVVPVDDFVVVLVAQGLGDFLGLFALDALDVLG